MKKLFVPILFIIFFTGCKSTMKTAVKPEQLSGEYIVYEINDIALDNSATDIPTFTLSAEDSYFQGNTGCNSIFGPYELDGSKIKFPNLAVSEKYCPEGNTMEIERKFVEALNEVKDYRLHNRVLTLYGKGNNILLRATKTQK